jgi:hypothetical protein
LRNDLFVVVVVVLCCEYKVRLAFQDLDGFEKKSLTLKTKRDPIRGSRFDLNINRFFVCLNGTFSFIVLSIANRLWIFLLERDLITKIVSIG